MGNKKLDKQIDDALKNITNDRAVTTSLLNDLMEYMKKSSSTHAEVGPVAAKYVETLQRSNEQLVKLVGIMNKNAKAETGLSMRDKEELFDLIKESKDSDG
jgi:glutaredoxin-related protein